MKRSPSEEESDPPLPRSSIPGPTIFGKSPMELAIGAIEFDLFSGIISAAENISSKLIYDLKRASEGGRKIHLEDESSSTSEEGPLIEVLDDTNSPSGDSQLVLTRISGTSHPLGTSFPLTQLSPEPSEASTEPL